MKKLTLLMMSALCSSFPFLTNAQVPCADVVVQCRDGLIEFAKDFLKVPGKDCKQWEGPCTTESEIFRTGFVGIGTPKTEGWYDGRLFVKGGIVTERLQICKPAWCDYVFSDTFKLRSLPEVEAYVKQHKHLPGSTPQADIEKKGGLSLDVETVNQQEKIEEAYLHLIALKKRMDRLAQKMPATVLQKTDNQQDRTKLQDQGPHITAAQLPVLLWLLREESAKLPCRQWQENDKHTCATWSHIHRTGKVAIGTARFSNLGILTVKNGIITDQVTIKDCQTGNFTWCDYVFEPGYPLLSLEQVAKHIEEKRHLPGMPSAAEIEKEGSFELGDITFRQQEKIEEMYLYLIALEKKVADLEAEWAVLQRLEKPQRK